MALLGHQISRIHRLTLLLHKGLMHKEQGFLLCFDVLSLEISTKTRRALISSIVVGKLMVGVLEVQLRWPSLTIREAISLLEGAP